MTPEQYQRVGELYHAALELEPSAREGFLNRVCGDDATLRREVDSLLSASDKARTYFAAPATEVAAGLVDAQTHASLVGQSLNHYRVLSLLGEGGMGEVYLAYDTRLGRKVAIKVLPARFTRDADRVRRFEKEARAASSLNHPNLITIHEIGQVASAHHIVTEFVEGETLRGQITKGALTIDTTLEVAEQIASALAAAHAVGIIHRDIKPENVMVRPDGLVKVLDFGLAKLSRSDFPPADPESSTLAALSTESGVVMGTISYMSPEQVRGQKVDASSDIFSLGVVLYEMIAGRRPFEGGTKSDVIVSLLTAEPLPLRQHCTEAPVELERIVSKCLAKDRADRYESAKELIADLKKLRLGDRSEQGALSHRIDTARPKFAPWRWAVVAVLAATLMVGLFWFFSWRRMPAVQPDQIKSLAVLPLENLSGDAAQEYFADGMTEALISNLSQIRALRVISRTSVMRFKGIGKPLAEIARELNVEAVIEGSVQRAGGRVKITARLIQAVTETPLRSFDYEGELADVLKLQSEVASAVAREIRTRVTAEERERLASARRVNPDAHEAYLLGRSHLRRQNEADIKLAIGHFEHSIQLDKSYAPSWAGLSLAWLQRGLWGAMSFRQVETPARQATLRALELDSSSAEAYTSLALVKHRYEWDWAGSERDFRRSLELDPGNVEAHRFFAFLLTALGRHDEAIRQIQTAEQLDPLSSLVLSDFGWALYRARKYDQALQRVNRAIELDPLNQGAYVRQCWVYNEMGGHADALASLSKAKTLQGDGGITTYNIRLALVYARMGRREEALRILKDLQHTTNASRFRSRDVAAVWTALGNKDEAFKVLSKLLEQRAELIIFMKVDPWFDSLHSDPRWKELLRLMNFPEG